jgi:hypothetical protein
VACGEIDLYVFHKKKVSFPGTFTSHLFGINWWHTSIAEDIKGTLTVVLGHQIVLWNYCRYNSETLHVLNTP